MHERTDEAFGLAIGLGAVRPRRTVGNTEILKRLAEVVRIRVAEGPIGEHCRCRWKTDPLVPVEN